MSSYYNNDDVMYIDTNNSIISSYYNNDDVMYIDTNNSIILLTYINDKNYISKNVAKEIFTLNCFIQTVLVKFSVVVVHIYHVEV